MLIVQLRKHTITKFSYDKWLYQIKHTKIFQCVLKTYILMMKISPAWLTVILSLISESHFLLEILKAIMSWDIEFVVGFTFELFPCTRRAYWPWLVKGWILMKFSGLFPARTIPSARSATKMWSAAARRDSKCHMLEGRFRLRGFCTEDPGRREQWWCWKEDSADAEHMMRLSRGELANWRPQTSPINPHLWNLKPPSPPPFWLYKIGQLYD